MASGKSEEDLLKEIAEKMTQNQISFDSKSEEEKKQLVAKIDIVAASQMVELQKKFNSLMGNIKSEIPENARIMVLEGIMDKVESQNLKSVDSIFLSEEVKNYASTIVTEVVNNNSEVVDKNTYFEKLEATSILSMYSSDVEKGLENKYAGYYKTSKEIYEKVAEIEEIFGGLNKKELEEKIQKANSGDEKAILEIIGIMSVLPFVETTVSLDEMKELDKIRALEAIDNLAVLYEECGTKEAMAIAEKLSEKWGIDLIRKDEDGNKIIDRTKISLFAREKGIDYQRANFERLKDNVQSYEALDGVEDCILETKIEAQKYSISRNLTAIIMEVQNGANVEDYNDIIREMFNNNFDASLREINEDAGMWVTTNQEFSKEEIMLQLNILKQGITLYEDASLGKIDGDIDRYVDIEFNEILEKSVDFMKKHKIQDKELLDTMLRVAPEKTQQLLKKAKFFESFSEKKLQESEMERKNEKPKTNDSVKKIDNLVKTLKSREKVKGIDEVLDFATGHIKNDKKIEMKNDFAKGAIRFLENRENSYEESERLARKKLFSTIISERIYDEDILKSMVEIDKTTIKEMIDDLIEKQNLKENDGLDTIMDLSASLKESSKEKVISADKAVKSFIEETSEETPIFEGSKGFDEGR